MADRTNANRNDVSRKNQKKGGKRKNLEQYMDDDMIEESSNKAPIINQQRNNIMEEEDEEAENINLDDNQSKERLGKENMDKISDILVSMIFKNKVNSKNAFDVPLPNVEHLSDFYQASGDSSWKKLSQTLDAGAKIYGFRVDSVHTETYKVLGGLNRTELAEDEMQDEAQQQQMEEEKEIIRKNKRDSDGDNTLEKNLSNIDANKYDLEFDLDPLFQKTSAKFDEGGAKGLLLNNININSEINLMFDSGNVIENEKDVPTKNQKRTKITRNFLKEIHGVKTEMDQLVHLKLCPELTQFKIQYLDNMKDLNDLIHLERNPSQNMAIEGGDALDNLLTFENVEDEERNLKNELEQVNGNHDMPMENYDMPIDSFAFHEDENGTMFPSQTMNENTQTTNTNGFGFNSRTDELSRELNFNNIEDRMSTLGAGKALDSIVNDHRNWMGPEAWKIKVNRKAKNNDNDSQSTRSGKAEREPPKPKKKTNELSIDFDMKQKEKVREIFGPKKKSTSKKIVEPQPITFNANSNVILPMDFQVKTYRLNNLFLRSIDFRVPDKEENDNNELTRIDNSFEMDDGFAADDALDPQVQEEIEKNLDAFARKNSRDLEYDKSNRNVNIKALKESIWGYLENKLPNVEEMEIDEQTAGMKKGKVRNAKHNVQEKEIVSFTDVCESVPSLIGGSKQKNVTIHSCFVTMLHLANEKGLRFVKEGEDFFLYKETN